MKDEDVEQVKGQEASKAGTIQSWIENVLALASSCQRVQYFPCWYWPMQS